LNHQISSVGKLRRDTSNSACFWKPTIWIADAHRDNGKRFVVHADEKLTAFVELESAIRAAES
jgi:hypothetical protein